MSCRPGEDLASEAQTWTEIKIINWWRQHCVFLRCIDYETKIVWINLIYLRWEIIDNVTGVSENVWYNGRKLWDLLVFSVHMITDVKSKTQAADPEHKRQSPRAAALSSIRFLLVLSNHFQWVLKIIFEHSRWWRQQTIFIQNFISMETFLMIQ